MKLHVISLSVALACLFGIYRLANHRSDELLHAKRTSAEVERADALLVAVQHEVLRVQFDVSLHYDVLVERLQELADSSLALVDPEFELTVGSTESQRALSGRYRLAVERLTALSEEFKSAHAVLLNSSAYLPFAVRELFAKAPPDWRQKRQGLRDLVGDVMGYRARPTAELRARLMRAISDHRRVLEPAEALERDALLVLQHCDIILTRQGVVDELREHIATSDARATLAALQTLLHREVDVRGQRLEQYRQLSYAFSVAILFWLGYLLYRLARTTRALKRANSALHTHNRDLASARQAAEVAARAKATFLANMSHEIRTPLSGVMGAAELLARERLDDQQADYVDIIQTSARSLMTVINDVLDLSKIDAEKLQLRDQPFDLGAIVFQVCEPLAVIAHQKGIALLLDHEAALSAQVRGDPDRLKQVLFNLIGNAVKFTERGHVLVETRLVARESEDSYERIALAIRVIDTGIGVPEDQQAHIFEAFQQADSASARHFGGTGLGLSISQQLVSLMGGSLTLESAPGVGTRVVVALSSPAVPATPESDVAGGASAQDAPSLAGLAVGLAIAYEPERALVSRWLRGWGAQVEVGATVLALPTAGLDALVVDGDRLSPACRTWWHETRPRLEIPVLALRHLVGRDEATEPAGPFADNPGLLRPVYAPRLRARLSRLLHPADGQGAPAQPRTSVRDTGSPAGVERARLLIVDDNQINRRILARMARELGYATCEVESGEAALERLAAEPFDLVFMDCQMPGLDGYETTRRIRTLEHQERRWPIIAQTASALPEDIERALAAGMDDAMSKPYDLDTVRRMLEKWLPVASG